MLETIYLHYQNEVLRRTEAGRDVEMVSAEVMDEMRAGFLGDRLSMMSLGSAADDP